MAKAIIYDQVQMAKLHKSMPVHGIFICFFPHLEEGVSSDLILKFFSWK